MRTNFFGKAALPRRLPEPKGDIAENSGVDTLGAIIARCNSARADKRDGPLATTEKNSAEMDMLDNGYDSFADLFIDFKGTLQQLRDGTIPNATAIIPAEPLKKYLEETKILSSAEKAQAFIETFQFYTYRASYTEADLGNNSRIPVLQFTFESKSDERSVFGLPEYFLVPVERIQVDTNKMFIADKSRPQFNLSEIGAPKTGLGMSNDGLGAGVGGQPPLSLEDLGAAYLRVLVAQTVSSSGSLPIPPTPPGSHPRFDLMSGMNAGARGGGQPYGTPIHRSEKDAALDAMMTGAVRLMSPEGRTNLIGDETHANFITARHKLNSACHPSDTLMSRNISQSTTTNLVTWNWLELSFTIFGEDNKINSQKELDDAFLFAALTLSMFGKEYSMMIQYLQMSAAVLMRRHTSLSIPQVVSLIDIQFRKVRSELDQGNLAEHQRPSRHNLIVDSMRVAEVLQLSSESNTTKLMVESAQQRESLDIKQQLKSLQGGSRDRGHKDSVQVDRTKPKGANAATISPTQPAANGRRPTGGTPGGGAANRPPPPPYIAGGPYCYFQYKVGKPCYQQTICQHNPARAHGFPPGTDAVLSTAFIAWVQAHIQ